MAERRSVVVRLPLAQLFLVIYISLLLIECIRIAYHSLHAVQPVFFQCYGHATRVGSIKRKLNPER